MGMGYHIRDEAESTLFILDSERNIRKSYRYDAFGRVLEERGDIENRLTYTGQMYDGGTGQYYLRARFYNPVTGRFLQEDVYRGDGLNLYAYCANNPVKYYDPSGYMSLCPGGKTFPGNGDRENEVRTLYRGDRASVTPDDVFQNGFKPKGTHDDALLHTESNTTAGNFVSTSSNKEIAIEFAGKNGYVYEVRTGNYVDINSTYGNKAHYPEQMEFSIPGGIKPSEIMGAYKMQGGKIRGEFISNPIYGGN